MHTLQEKNFAWVRGEVDDVLTSVETRVQDAVLTAIENLVIPRLELFMKPSNVTSGRGIDANVLELDQREFLRITEGLRMTASSRINSHTELKRNDETRGNITVEENDLMVNEKNSHRQTYAHHMVTTKKHPQEIPEFHSGWFHFGSWSFQILRI